MAKSTKGIPQDLEDRRPKINVPSAATGKLPTTDWDNIISKLDNDTGPRIVIAPDSTLKEILGEKEFAKRVLDGSIKPFNIEEDEFFTSIEDQTAFYNKTQEYRKETMTLWENDLNKDI